MLIVPEIQTVLIFVPRTGSGSLRRAVAETYPKSMLPYRHMEADGVPFGYDRWRRIGVVRHPVARLWSLYKFMRSYQPPQDAASNCPAYRYDAHHFEALKRSADGTFSDWIVNNHMVFISAHDHHKASYFYPGLSRRHTLPENRVSQHLYIRPDLGTEVWRFDRMPELYQSLGVSETPRSNVTAPSPIPQLSTDAENHIRQFCAWDFEQDCAPI